MQTLKLTLKLGLIALVAAALLAGAHKLTKDAIQASQEAELIAALRIALPEFDNSPATDSVTIEDPEQGTVRVFRGRKNGSASGYGFTWQAKNGYSGNIQFLIGLTTDGSIQGISILKHAETPGLGAKITTREYLSQFTKRNLHNTNWLVTKDGGDVDVITGATITPRALTAGIKAALEFFEHHKTAIISNGTNSDTHQSDVLDSLPKSPLRRRSPSTTCFNIATTRYALTESPLKDEANACFNRQYETFGNCVCSFNFKHKYQFPQEESQIRQAIAMAFKSSNMDMIIQGYCALPQQERTRDDVLQMIKYINLSKNCLIAMDCINNLFAECPIIAGHADPQNPIEKANYEK